MIIGIVIGLILAIKAFDIKTDILGIPYRNQPVILTEDIFIQQNGVKVTIPKDSKLVRRYTTQYGNTYVLYFYYFGGSFKESNRWEYFFACNFKKECK